MRDGPVPTPWGRRRAVRAGERAVRARVGGIVTGSIGREYGGEVSMPTKKVRINLANQLELLELPGLGPQQAEAIVKYRAEHGPIRDSRELSSIVGAASISTALRERVDFSPADATAPEAPGA